MARRRIIPGEPGSFAFRFRDSKQVKYQLEELSKFSKTSWAEGQAYARLLLQGAQIHRNGWPDFVVQFPDQTIKFLEIKGPNDRLSYDQEKLHRILQTLGIQVEVTYVDRLDISYEELQAATQRFNLLQEREEFERRIRWQEAFKTQNPKIEEEMIPHYLEAFNKKRNK